MIVTPSLLKTFPLLKNLSESELDSLAAQSKASKHSRRGVVLAAGTRAPTLCFLFEGRLQAVDFTIDGREVGLYFVEPGDFCGELTLFDEGEQQEHIISLTSALVVNVPREAIQKSILSNAALMPIIGNKLAQRIRQLSAQRSMLGLPNISQRVCCQLWMLVPADDKKRMRDSEIRNPPTHMEIAIMLNISRESVTRVFQALQSRNIVQRNGPNSLLVPSMETLKSLAEGHESL